MYTKKLGIFLIFCASLFELNAQSNYNSPYTRFGFGRINGLQSAYHLGQGGLSYTDAHYNQVNVSNAASYAHIARQLPVFDVAINSELMETSSSSSSRLFKTTEVANFTLALPTGKRSGLVFSYQPFSKMGYNVTDSLTTIDSVSQANLYKGQGSINKLLLGYGHQLYKSDSSNFSVSFGVNASYVFGSLSHLRQQHFESGSGYLSFLEKDTTNIKSFTFEGGLYAKYSKEKMHYGLGVVYSPTFNLNAKNEYVSYLYLNDINAVVDTLQSSDVQSGTITLPGTLGVAFSVNYNHTFGGGIQFTQRNMSDYSENFLSATTNSYFTNSNEINAGFWYKPSKSEFLIQGNSFKNAVYKAGFRYSTLGLNINNVEITEIAASTGINVPLVSSGSFSSINFGIEFGIRGTKDQSLIEERFIRAKIGIAITPSRTDRWFVKRKYN
ncbi:MAG: hypothetical protein ACLGGV_05720 [Bacteroidia bacterium]